MTHTKKQFDVIVIGAGFAGMYAVYRLRKLGFSVQAIEAGGDVGGTWYWNRYPGARCDVHSLEYSYQFSEELQQEWNWSEKYAAQSEILDYARHVADRFDLRKNIQFNTRIQAMLFNEASCIWELTTQDGEEFQARHCIMATGCLSMNNVPDFQGLESFKGEVFHTGNWPHEGVDFSGKRVGIIGTGSSAIQAIPIIAEEAGSLTVFQRTAGFSVPAQNEAMDKTYEAQIKFRYQKFRQENFNRFAALNNNPNPISALGISDEEREATFEGRWQTGGLSFLASFNDLATNIDANRTASEFVHKKIHQIIDDPKIADLLCPPTILGCKRLCVDTGYYKTFNRTNVKLIDVSANPIEKVTTHGIKTNAEEYDLDILILATGFDAMTGALLSIDIQGVDGLTLQEKWQGGPKNYLGLSVSGFPNFFTITGPGSPSVLANMIVAIEQHVDWIADCLIYLRENSLSRIEAQQHDEEQWVELVNQIAGQTLYADGCNSWYTGANIPGKSRVFMPYLGFPSYVEKCKSVAANNYTGFKLN
ncbi:MAG: cyclohexanone monooxygenase [SAR86 cluster bacterium]|uniref:Cyclohexanone monooxygenase n=1 Tax=SAR86 cluster bacterium TaxID=2030880 RepID=A0A2A5B731_9GAMM|nr:MAG: cyclohexanone monooxygenase [SAR86 cluster bacterium]